MKPGIAKRRTKIVTVRDGRMTTRMLRNIFPSVLNTGSVTTPEVVVATQPPSTSDGLDHTVPAATAAFQEDHPMIISAVEKLSG